LFGVWNLFHGYCLYLGTWLLVIVLLIYRYNAPMGYLFDFEAQIIHITNPQVIVEIQELITEIRIAEFTNLGMAYPKIADASGKAYLGGGVTTGITVYLYPNWQLKFWEGTYTASITGGNLIGGPGDNPIAYTNGVQVILVQSASSTIVHGGTVLTVEEHDKLMTGLDVTIPDNVWDEILAGHQTAGSAGRELTVARKRATLASLKK
jgi:hypothetical protein